MKIKKYRNILIFVLLVLFFVSNFIYPKYYSSYVKKYAEIFEIDQYLVYSVIKTESRFNKDAISNKGAKGLMQVMDNTGKEIFDKLNVHEKYQDLQEPEANIMVGSYYLKQLLERYNGDLDKAIAAYNSGPSNVDAWDKKPGKKFSEKIEFPETKNYLKKVKKDYLIYKILYKFLLLSWMNLPDIFVQVKVLIMKIFRTIKGVFV